MRKIWAPGTRQNIVGAAGVIALTIGYLVINPLLMFTACLMLVFAVSNVLEKHSAMYGYSVFTVCIFIMKLLLISENEMITTANDAWSYVATADGNPWSTVGGSPGYPIWLWLSRAIGLPQRITIEILFISASALFASVCGKRLFGFSGYAALLILAVFSPVSYFLFDLVLSDGFYLCLTLMAIALMILSLQARTHPTRWLTLILMGVALGALAITRKEVVILPAVIGLLLIMSIVLLRRVDKKSLRQACLIGFYRAMTPALVAVSVTLVIMILHWKAEGVFALSSAELSSHSRLLENLAAIKTSCTSNQAPQQRYISISRPARYLAYYNSPTLNKLMPIIENPDNIYLQTSQLSLKLPGEVGSGWIWHIFNDAAIKSGVKSIRQLDEFYKQINSEIEIAFDSGKLKRRFVLHPILGADAGVWLPYIGQGFIHSVKAMLFVYGPQTDENFEQELFDRVCLRRASMVPKNEGFIQGWAFSEHGNIAKVLIETKTVSESAVEQELPDSQNTIIEIQASEIALQPDGSSCVKDVGEAPHIIYRTKSKHVAATPSLAEGLRFSATRFDRKDVQEVYEKNGKIVVLESGFRAKLPIAIGRNMRFKFLLDDGQTVFDENPQKGSVKSLPFANGNNRVTYAIDSLPADNRVTKSGWRNTVMLTLQGIYISPIFWITCLVMTFAGFAKLGREVALGNNDALLELIAMLTIASMILFKLLFYTVIDAAAWSVEPRYVQVGSLFLVMLACMGTLSLIRGTAHSIVSEGFRLFGRSSR